MNIISNVLNTSLNYFFNLTGDWGIAILLLTVVVRAVLMPLSIKQKLNMQEQQKMSKTLEELKEKYKNNKKKLDEELQKHYAESAKGMLGCLVTLLQLPIVFTLYNVIIKMPMQAGTILVPWVESIKMWDNLFIIPILYTISMLCPNLLSYVPFLKVISQAKVNKANILITSIISMLITFKTPVAVGIYLITTSIFSFIEEIIFRLYIRRKSFAN